MFQGCQRIVEDWQKILMVRSLVVNPHEDMRTWLKYASLCGKSGRLVSNSPPWMGEDAEEGMARLVRFCLYPDLSCFEGSCS